MGRLRVFPNPIPDYIMEILGSKLSSWQVVEKLRTEHRINVTHTTICSHRRRLWPGRDWWAEAVDPRRKTVESMRRPTPREMRLINFCADVRRFNLNWIACVNASRLLRNMPPLDFYGTGDLT